MKRFFYFSDKSLEFVEIKNFSRKTILTIALSTIILTSIILGIFFLIHSNLIDDREKLVLENKALKSEIVNLKEQYLALSTQLKELGYLGNKLRTMVNLEPLDDKERILGKGGGLVSNDLIKNLNFSDDIKKSFEAIELVINRFEFEKNEFKNLEKRMLENENFFDALPVLIPTVGEFSIDGFGMRLHPILKVVRMHEGIDILNDIGTPVYAPGNGVVSYIGNRGGLGITLEIEHGFGYKTVYGHLSKILVKEGQKVKRGDKIALSGNTGLSTGPHLHYEVHYNGVPQDPVYYFLEHSKTYLADKSKNKMGGNQK